MLTWIPDILTITSAIAIIVAIFWRVSIFLKLVIEKYTDDKKIDGEEMVEIYYAALSMFSWIFALFNVDFKQLVPEVDDLEDDPEEEE